MGGAAMGGGVGGATTGAGVGSVQNLQLSMQFAAMNTAFRVHSPVAAHPAHDGALAAASAHAVGAIVVFDGAGVGGAAGLGIGVGGGTTSWSVGADVGGGATAAGVGGGATGAVVSTVGDTVGAIVPPGQRPQLLAQFAAWSWGSISQPNLHLHWSRSAPQVLQAPATASANSAVLNFV